jgi:hypothetical protein
MPRDGASMGPICSSIALVSAKGSASGISSHENDAIIFPDLVSKLEVLHSEDPGGH